MVVNIDGRATELVDLNLSTIRPFLKANNIDNEKKMNEEQILKEIKEVYMNGLKTFVNKRDYRNMMLE